MKEKVEDIYQQIIKLGFLKNRYLMHTSQLISIANILISIFFAEQMSKDACDVRSDQNTGFNIAARYAGMKPVILMMGERL